MKKEGQRPPFFLGLFRILPKENPYITFGVRNPSGFMMGSATNASRSRDLAYFLRLNIFKSLFYGIRIQGRYYLVINRRNIYIYTICYNNF